MWSYYWNSCPCTIPSSVYKHLKLCTAHYMPYKWIHGWPTKHNANVWTPCNGWMSVVGDTKCLRGSNLLISL
ncbi:hypothetical protein GDO78_009059 [Eleutherodactylus coqui]|uniref:Uncharacterized protein n=1 Tax=Eleutherodactylus coqui TaxID=57060 RepID=A0A8J6F895_ELECQ|nr:hypothetical protein GDO78_009059 [Eleutherodactylus coqui]